MCVFRAELTSKPSLDAFALVLFSSVEASSTIPLGIYVMDRIIDSAQPTHDGTMPRPPEHAPVSAT